MCCSVWCVVVCAIMCCSVSVVCWGVCVRVFECVCGLIMWSIVRVVGCVCVCVCVCVDVKSECVFVFVIGCVGV